MSVSDRTVHSQRCVLLHVKRQQSPSEPVSPELLGLGLRRRAAAGHRPKPAAATRGPERLRVAHAALAGGRVSQLHAPHSPGPGALRVGGQPVPAQPGGPLRGAPVGRPHRLSTAQGRRHLLPGQQVSEAEVAVTGCERQHH